MLMNSEATAAARHRSLPLKGKKQRGKPGKRIKQPRRVYGEIRPKGVNRRDLRWDERCRTKDIHSWRLREQHVLCGQISPEQCPASNNAEPKKEGKKLNWGMNE